jgi:hypothetical protein
MNGTEKGHEGKDRFPMRLPKGWGKSCQQMRWACAIFSGNRQHKKSGVCILQPRQRGGSSTGRRGSAGIEFETFEHELQQGLPGGEDKVTH